MVSDSTSDTDSKQISNAKLMQNYNGTCNISCQNSISNASITAINDKIGGSIEMTQDCSVDAQCTFNVSQSALTDIIFKATNSTAAASGAGALGGNVVDITNSHSSSYQEINQNIQEIINQKCDITSVNDMNNVSIYAANSNIGGNLQIGQYGKVGGSCALQASMSATAMAQGTSNNCAASGKGKKMKKSCGGKGGKSIGTFILYGAIALVAFTVIMMVVRYFKEGGLPPCPPGLQPGNKQFPCSAPKPGVPPRSSNDISPGAVPLSSAQKYLGVSPSIQERPTAQVPRIQDVSDLDAPRVELLSDSPAN